MAETNFEPVSADQIGTVGLKYVDVNFTNESYKIITTLHPNVTAETLVSVAVLYAPTYGNALIATPYFADTINVGVVIRNQADWSVVTAGNYKVRVYYR